MSPWGRHWAPLWPIFSWLIWKNKLLQKESDTNPKLYLRYVDDIFAIFEDQRFSTTFLDLLNSQHKSIRFTMEKSNGTISFLDVEIKSNPNGFDT